MTRDPVCGKNVLQLTETTKAEHQGHVYYFCSSECKQAFEQVPDRYVDAAAYLAKRRMAETR